MKRPAPQTLAAAGVLALLALVAILTARGEAPGYEPFASTDYRAGGFRAWVTLLQHEGVATSRFVQRPAELDAAIDTLVSAPSPRAAPGTRRPADVAALATWVRAGGRLVYIGRESGLSAAETTLLHLPFWLPDVGPRGPLAGPDAAAVPTLAGLGTNRMLFVERRGSALLSDGNGDIVVRYPLGRGEVVAVSDPVPLTNERIGLAANARLAYLLGVPRRAGGVVAFDDALHGALVDRPWYRALSTPLRVALSIAGIALVLALAGSALGGAAPMRLRPQREPTSAEFVAALAALYERTRARAAAQAILVRDALGAASAADGEPLVRRGGADAEPIRRLAAGLAAPAATDAELLASAKLAYTIRKDFTDGGHRDGSRAAFAGRTRTRRRR